MSQLAGTVEFPTECAPRRVKITMKASAKSTDIAVLIKDWINDRRESPFSSGDIKLPTGWQATFLEEAQRGNSNTIWLLVQNEHMGPAEIDGRIRSAINAQLGSADRFVEAVEVLN